MTSRRSFAWIAPVALLTACGGSEAPRATAVYTAEQLNALASPPPPEEVPGATATSPDAQGGQGAQGATASSPTVTPPVGTARVRLIHAAPDPAASHAVVYLDDQHTALFDAMAYRRDSAYHEVPAGEHTVSVRPAAAAADAVPVATGRTPALRPEHTYTVVVHGLATGEPHMAFASAEDDDTLPEAGHARLRFFHALAGVGAVDVCSPGAHPAAVFTNVAYGAWGGADATGGYFTVPTGHPVTLQVHAQSTTACTGRVLGSVTHTLGDRHVYTTVAVGRVPTHPEPGAHAEPRQLLVCSDAPRVAGENCTAVPIR